MATIGSKTVTIKSARAYPNSVMVEIVLTGTSEGYVFAPVDSDFVLPTEILVKFFYQWAKANGVTFAQAVGKVVTITVAAV